MLAGIYKIGQQKASESWLLMSTLTLCGCLLSMALAIGYERYSLGLSRPMGRGRTDRSATAARSPVARKGSSLSDPLREVNGDSDGLISYEEAARAAEEFIRKLDSDGRGGIDRETLRKVLRDYMGPHGHAGSPPPPSPMLVERATH